MSGSKLIYGLLLASLQRENVESLFYQTFLSKNGNDIVYRVSECASVKVKDVFEDPSWPMNGEERKERKIVKGNLEKEKKSIFF